MDYKLFDDYITLQALLKNVGVIHSGGAIKVFLAQNPVLFNGEIETRRGKKVRIGDTIFLEKQELSISIIAPTKEEIATHRQEQTEKARVSQLVKKMNAENKQAKGHSKQNKVRKPIRFPGT